MTKFMNTRRSILLALPGATLVLSGCAGMRVGGGTATGVVLGTIAGAATGNPGKGAVIGGAIGAMTDAANGEQPIAVEPLPRPRGGDYYYEERRYYEERPVIRPVPRRPAPRYKYWDRRCGCYRYE